MSRFEFRGAALAVQTEPAGEVLLSGPAGTGKSLACLWKLHHVCATTPRVRALIVRKTRVSLTESALVTFEQKVLGAAAHIADGAGRANRHSYRYPNGSEIVVGGLDKPTRIMSTDWDLIFVQEAIELTEDEWEALTTRLRNGRLPIQQLIADTNPSSPSHWLKRRCDAGRTRMLESRHEDNPYLWAGGTWTQAGVAYIAKLDQLTGPRKQRLRHGRWVQAEGVVYDTWDAARNLIDAFPGGDRLPPADWRRYLSVDFGYTNPFVAQWWAEDPDARLYLYREIYHTKRLVEDHAKQILDLMKDERKPDLIICDHDAEDRATLERHLKMPTRAAYKAVTVGIQFVAARLRPAGDGKPRLFILRDAAVERDQELVEARLPTCTAEEIDEYVWKDSAVKDEPVKEGDHGCDAARYLVAARDRRMRELKVYGV